MSGESEIKVNRALGKSANFFLIPEQYVNPLLVITGGLFFGYRIINTVIPIDAIVVVGIWLTLILTYLLFYGKYPWKLGGGFHEAPNWILGYNKFDSSQPQFKAKKKSVTQVGYGASTRKVEEFEKKLDVSCLVEICQGNNEIGAYLLEKNKSYRLVFVFGFSGIRSNLHSESIAAIIEALQDGLKDLKTKESLVFRCGKFIDNRAKSHELNNLKKTCGNTRVSYLMKALKVRFNSLLEQGKFNNNPCYIECSYSLDNTAIKGEDLAEQILAGIQEFSEKITGKNSRQLEDKYQLLLKKAYAEGFIFWREFLESKLKLKGHIEPLSAYEIYERDYQKYNEGEVPPSIPQVLRLKNNQLTFEINSPYHLTTSIFHIASPDADKKWVYLPGKQQYVGGLVYHERPGKWKGLKTQLEAGSACLNNSDTVDTEVVVELTKPNQDRLKYKTQKRTRDSNSSLSYAEKRKVIDVGANYNIQQNIELEQKFLEGNVVVNVGLVILVYRRSPEALKLAVNRFEDFFRQPAVVKREKEYFDEIWLTTLPFCWANILYKYNRQHQYWTDAAVCLLPLNFESTIATKGLCLISDKGGNPFHLNLYTKMPQHMALLGTTGSGKSVLMQGAVTMALGYGLDVTIIDKTRGDGTGTFDAITNFVGGAYFNTMRESNNLFENVNPREIRNREKREAADKIFRRFLKTALNSLLIAPTEPQEKIRNYKSVLTSALEKFFRDEVIQRRYEAAHRAGLGSRIWQDIPTMKDFLVFLGDNYLPNDASPGIISATSEIRYHLRVIVESPMGRLIAAPSTFDNSNRLVVYGIGDVEEDEMTPIALSAFSAAIRKSLRSTRSLFCMDEVSNLGSNYEIYGETLRGFCSRGRKEGVSVIYGGQDLDSIAAMPHSAQIIENTYNFLIGRLNPSALKILEEKLYIPTSISRGNTLDSFSNKDNNSTPWLLKTGSIIAPCHYYPSLQELCLIKNEPEFVEIRNKYFSKYENPYEAIDQLVKIIKNN